MNDFETLAGMADFFEDNDDVAFFIRSPGMLVRALRDLDQMIGMKGVKNVVIKQIKHLLVSIRLHGTSKINIYKLNALICGPPGVGKTELGKVLARIWTALGILRRSPKVLPLNSMREELEKKMVRINELNHQIAEVSQKILRRQKGLSIHKFKDIRKFKRTAQEWLELAKLSKTLTSLCSKNLAESSVAVTVPEDEDLSLIHI